MCLWSLLGGCVEVPYVSVQVVSTVDLHAVLLRKHLLTFQVTFLKLIVR